MSDIELQLARACSQTAEAAHVAADWLERNKAPVGAKSHGLQREFRRHERKAKGYEKAAQRPLCVGVFGASQVGKSYLVSALARRANKPLIAMFCGEEKDFLKDINPEAEQEATGLVTRFSIKPTSAQRSHPVAVRLLSQIDLVKILANTYSLDFDATKERVPTESDIEKALKDAQAAAKPTPVDGLTWLDIDDLHCYFDRQFAARRTVEVLKNFGYWTQLEELAPRLAINDRAKLYALLWGELPQFTNLYKLLYRALEGLGFAEEAYCPIEALIPREKSIINVAALAGLTEQPRETLQVLGSNNRSYNIGRSHLTAIVSELLIQIKEQPWDYFTHTDLLDFPGARTRVMIEDAESYVQKDTNIAELFRRGKVAYLFERYCAENELTSMLLCIVPGNQEVRTIPGMVQTWIHETHGSSPAERAKADTALFVVLTKFDRRFEEAKGKDDSSEVRWTAAINNSLPAYFGASKDNWAKEWKPGKPFDNCFWLRNPNFIAPGLIRYADSSDRTEIGVLEPQRVARFKQEYLANEMVSSHFRDPEKAWDAAFSLNDGGISYLAEALAPVCRPELKPRQILAGLRELRQRMTEGLREFHVSDDQEAEKRKRIELAERAVLSLADVVEGQRFGHLLNQLQIPSDDLQFIFRRVSAGGDKGGEIPGGSAPKFSSIMTALGLGDRKANPGAANGGQHPRDRHTGLAEAAMEFWADRLQALPGQARVLDFLRVQSETVEILVRELLAGSERLTVGQEIAHDLRSAPPVTDSSAIARLKPAAAAAERINCFVWKLGQDKLDAGRRARAPMANGQTEEVFKERQVIESLDGLPEHGDVYYQPFIRDWIVSFLALVRNNVEGGTKQKFSIEESGRLGAILAQLRD